MVWAVFLLLRSGTRGGINWTWWQIVGCHKRQSLSWDGWITIRLFVCEERLWSINVITQTSQTSSFDRSTPHLPHPVTSTPPSAAAPDFSRPCRLLTRTLVMIATWQPLPADMCFRLLNKDQPELQRITMLHYRQRESLKRHRSLPSMSLKMHIFWDVTPYRPVNTNAYYPTRRNIQGDLNLQQRLCENLTTCVYELISVISTEDISIHRFTFVQSDYKRSRHFQCCIETKLLMI